MKFWNLKTWLIVAVLCVADVMPAIDLDPFDMLNFDPSSNTMKESVKKDSVTNRPGSPVSDIKSEQQKMEEPENLEEPMEQPGILEENTEQPVKGSKIEIPPESLRDGGGSPRPSVDISKCPVRVSMASRLFRQYVNTMLYHLKGKVLEGGGSEYDVRTRLGFKDVMKLRRYGDSETEVDLQVSHEILTRMIITVQPTSPYDKSSQRLWIEDKMGISFEKLTHSAIVLSCLMVFVSLLMRLKFTMKGLFLFLFLFFFIASVCLTWFSLYKREVSKQHYAMAKDMPDHCKKRENRDSGFVSVTLGWLSSQFTFSKDECIDYYEVLLIDPLVKVSPVEALAVTATRFFIAPLRHVAEGVSDALRALLKDLPVQLWPIILASMAIVTFLLLFMGFGYRVALPFGMLAIEPARRHLEIDNQQLNRIEEVKKNEMLEFHKKQDEIQKMLMSILDNQDKSEQLAISSHGAGDATRNIPSLSPKSKPISSPGKNVAKVDAPKNIPSASPKAKSISSHRKFVEEVDAPKNILNMSSIDKSISSPGKVATEVETTKEPTKQSKEGSVQENRSIENIGGKSSYANGPVECTEKDESPSKPSSIPVRRKSTESQPPTFTESENPASSVKNHKPNDDRPIITGNITNVGPIDNRQFTK